MSNKKILILGNNFVKNERLMAILNSLNFQKEVINKTFSMDAINELAKASDIDLAIISLPNKRESKEETQIRSLLKQDYKAKLLFIYESEEDLFAEVKTYVENSVHEASAIYPIKLVQFTSIINDTLVEGDQPAPDQAPASASWVPIKFILIKKVAIAPCHLHVKLGDDKYIKLINQGDPIELSVLEKYENRNITFLYIALEDFYKYSESFFSDNLIAPEITKNKETHALKSHEMLHSIVKDIGVNAYVIDTAEKAVTEIANTVQNTPVGKLFDFFANAKNQFIYDHSFITSVFATAICEKMDWSSQKTVEKICMASMLHDFGFRNPKLAFEENLGQIDMKSLPKEQREEILNHPSVMAEVLSEIPETASDVINIVQNHHEGRGEESYPKKVYASNLSQLNCVFIVAHEFAVQLYKIGFNFKKVPDVIERLEEMFSSGNTKKSLEALIETIKEGGGPL